MFQTTCEGIRYGVDPTLVCNTVMVTLSRASKRHSELSPSVQVVSHVETGAYVDLGLEVGGTRRRDGEHGSR